MIIYFSGTGNSKYVAEKIAEKTGDQVLRLNDIVREKSTVAGENIIISVPTYAWRIPKVVHEWIRRAEFTEAKRIWFVMTCGGEIGNAAKYNRQLAEEKGLEYMGTAGIVMPENYIAMFNAPGEEKARAIIDQAEPVIQQAAEKIAAGEALPAPRNNLYDRLMSGPVNGMFYAMSVHDRKFFATDACTGCGLCEKLCPLGNVRIGEAGKPAWGGDCTHCMACICHCPMEAIEYGKTSKGKPRYHID